MPSGGTPETQRTAIASGMVYRLTCDRALADITTVIMMTIVIILLFLGNKESLVLILTITYCTLVLDVDISKTFMRFLLEQQI